jgi:hypothetical protein
MPNLFARHLWHKIAHEIVPDIVHDIRGPLNINYVRLTPEVKSGSRAFKFEHVNWDGVITLRPLSFRPRSFCPGHFVP